MRCCWPISIFAGRALKDASESRIVEPGKPGFFVALALSEAGGPPLPRFLARLYTARLSATEYCQFGAATMPKQKTHKGTKKRFRLTAKGKAKHRQAGTSHLASRKSKKRRRNLRGTKVVSSTVLKQIHRALAASSG